MYLQQIPEFRHLSGISIGYFSIIFENFVETKWIRVLQNVEKIPQNFQTDDENLAKKGLPFHEISNKIDPVKINLVVGSGFQ